MNRAALLATTCLLLTAPAHARDERLASRLYSPDEVVRIDGKAGVQASIAFADDEHIENVAVGDSNAWQITPNKRANLLFVKPLADRAHTNMTVVTDRHTYFFDLVAAPSAHPIYVLRFTYPEAPKSEVQQAATPALTEAEALAASQPVTDPADLNFAWKSKGPARLLPARVYDDGQSTYLTWTAGTEVPAILVRDTKGTEGPVNYAVRGETIVIDEVPATIILRYGRDSATLENIAPARAPRGGATALAAQTTER